MVIEERVSSTKNWSSPLPPLTVIDSRLLL